MCYKRREMRYKKVIDSNQKETKKDVNMYK